jgi:hypothetical protein
MPMAQSIPNLSVEYPAKRRQTKFMEEGFTRWNGSQTPNVQASSHAALMKDGQFSSTKHHLHPVKNNSSQKKYNVAYVN